MKKGLRQVDADPPCIRLACMGPGALDSSGIISSMSAMPIMHIAINSYCRRVGLPPAHSSSSSSVWSLDLWRWPCNWGELLQGELALNGLEFAALLQSPHARKDRVEEIQHQVFHVIAVLQLAVVAILVSPQRPEQFRRHAEVLRPAHGLRQGAEVGCDAGFAAMLACHGHTVPNRSKKYKYTDVTVCTILSCIVMVCHGGESADSTRRAVPSVQQSCRTLLGGTSKLVWGWMLSCLDHPQASPGARLEVAPIHAHSEFFPDP